MRGSLRATLVRIDGGADTVAKPVPTPPAVRHRLVKSGPRQFAAGVANADLRDIPRAFRLVEAMEIVTSGYDLIVVRLTALVQAGDQPLFHAGEAPFRRYTQITSPKQGAEMTDFRLQTFNFCCRHHITPPNQAVAMQATMIVQRRAQAMSGGLRGQPVPEVRRRRHAGLHERPLDHEVSD